MLQIRSGRIDQRHELPSPGQEQIKKLFLAFYPEARLTEEGLLCASQFATEVPKAVQTSQETLSMASLQNLFILGRKLSFTDFLKDLPRSIAAQNITIAVANKNGAAENGANGKADDISDDIKSDGGSSEILSQDGTGSSQDSSEDE